MAQLHASICADANEAVAADQQVELDAWEQQLLSNEEDEAEEANTEEPATTVGSTADEAPSEAGDDDPSQHLPMAPLPTTISAPCDRQDPRGVYLKILGFCQKRPSASVQQALDKHSLTADKNSARISVASLLMLLQVQSMPAPTLEQLRDYHSDVSFIPQSEWKIPTNKDVLRSTGVRQRSDSGPTVRQLRQ